MNGNKISPEKITKPIQLLAAWLIGLILIDGSFLFSAQKISDPTWASGALVISAIINVPIFLFAIFLLQTKFRPEMQEDSYYSKYLKRRYSGSSISFTKTNVDNRIDDVARNIAKQLGYATEDKFKPIQTTLQQFALEQTVERFGWRRTLSELYFRPEFWSATVNKWKGRGLEDDVQELIQGGLLSIQGSDYFTCKLTELGKKIAQLAEKKKTMFKFKDEALWNKEHAEVNST